MHFSLTEEQRLIVDTTRDFVVNELYPHEAEVEATGCLRPELRDEIKRKAINAGLYAANMPAEVGGAGLDVYEHEPQVNPKLLEMESVVLLPHMGSATLEGRIEMGEKVLINIKTFADGHKPPDRVLATMF